MEHIWIWGYTIKNGKDYFTELGLVSATAGCESETLQQHRNPAAFRGLGSRFWRIELGPFQCLIWTPPIRLLQKHKLCMNLKLWKLMVTRALERESTVTMRSVEKRWRCWGSGRGLSDPCMLSRLGNFIRRPFICASTKWRSENTGERELYISVHVITALTISFLPTPSN